MFFSKIVMNKMITILLIVLVLLPMVRADLIVVDGKKDLSVRNVIANIDDFPDYKFVSFSTGPISRFRVIGNDGVISAPYKFSKVEAVYAIKQEDFNQTFFDETQRESSEVIEYVINQTKKEEYLDSVGLKVIGNVEHWGGRISLLSTKDYIEHRYVVEFGQVKTQPDDIMTRRNNLVYFYSITPLIALLIIIYLIWGRK